ncbi:hypothetical protein LPU83_pLPU83c_0235 (plasmid) [Rhizobium favelukesii]|uniref:Uncharacterized protein n=1 Tax=Rhizobium favelukesii TaxID=348824 RepID=W6RHW4_9HYPH|nr:hypothetical protein LPU83_pLPU83c_0235 [Rhizobium favelukesii]
MPILHPDLPGLSLLTGEEVHCVSIVLRIIR